MEKGLMQMTLNEIMIDYRKSVKGVALEVIRECQLESMADYQNSEEAVEMIDEFIDGNEWVIYTFQAKLVVLLSYNSETYLDLGINAESVTPHIIAYEAMRYDVNDMLNNEYFWADIKEGK